MSYCEKCGNKINKESIYCSSCGTKIEPLFDVSSSKDTTVEGIKENPTLKILGYLSIFFLLLIFIYPILTDGTFYLESLQERHFYDILNGSRHIGFLLESMLTLFLPLLLMYIAFKNRQVKMILKILMLLYFIYFISVSIYQT